MSSRAGLFSAGPVGREDRRARAVRGRGAQPAGLPRPGVREGEEPGPRRPPPAGFAVPGGSLHISKLGPAVRSHRGRRCRGEQVPRGAAAPARRGAAPTTLPPPLSRNGGTGLLREGSLGTATGCKRAERQKHPPVLLAGGGQRGRGGGCRVRGSPGAERPLGCFKCRAIRPPEAVPG